MNLATAIEIFGGGPGSGCQGPNCGRHKEYGQFTGGFRAKPGLYMWRGKNTSVVHRHLGPSKGSEVLEYDAKKGLTSRRKFPSAEEASNHIRERYGMGGVKEGVKAKGKQMVSRINSPAPVDGPEVYETRNRMGTILKQYRDQAGAEIAVRKADRTKFRLGPGYKALHQAEALKYGQLVPQDERLRPTTGGSGGTGGPGNG